MNAQIIGLATILSCTVLIGVGHAQVVVHPDFEGTSVGVYSPALPNSPDAVQAPPPEGSTLVPIVEPERHRLLGGTPNLPGPPPVVVTTPSIRIYSTCNGVSRPPGEDISKPCPEQLPDDE